jgi:hypothetical protein
VDTTLATSTQAAHPNIMTRGKWAKRITEAWQKQLLGVFETGTLLESAKAELRHGDWMAMITSGELPFKQSAVNKLMKIAACDHSRGNGFRELYRWLDGADLLIVRSDRREPLVVLPMKLAPEIAAIAEMKKKV